jgi:hypothetical protein
MTRVVSDGFAITCGHQNVNNKNKQKSKRCWTIHPVLNGCSASVQRQHRPLVARSESLPVALLLQKLRHWTTCGCCRVPQSAPLLRRQILSSGRSWAGLGDDSDVPPEVVAWEPVPVEKLSVVQCARFSCLQLEVTSHGGGRRAGAVTQLVWCQWLNNTLV